MKLIIDIPNSLYANLQRIDRHSIASARILDCVKNGTPLSADGEYIKKEDALNICHRACDGDMDIDEWIEREINKLPTYSFPEKEKGEWIPITYRPMTDEEKEYYSIQAGCDKEDLDTMLNCQLPDDGEEVLITVFGEVETDIFYRDVDGCSFENRDIDDVTAWMPKPKPYKRGMT